MRGLLALGCALGLAACEESSSPSESMNVGLLLPFTGEVGAMGISLEAGSRMAADQVNQHGGGVTGKRLRLVVADTHSDVGRALASLDALLDANVEVVIGPESAEVAAAALPILLEKRIVFVSPYGSGSTDVASVDYPWFRLAPTPTSFGQALAKRMVADGVTSATFLYSAGLYDAALVTAAMATFTQLGGVVVQQLQLTPSESDYFRALQDLRESAPVVLLAADSASGAKMVNDLSIVHPVASRQWYLSPSLKTDSFLRNVFSNKIEGAIGVAPSVVADVAAFDQAFAAASSGNIPQDGAYYYYDAVALVALSLERAWVGSGGQRLTFEDVRDAIREIARTRGVSTGWDDLPQALDLIRTRTLTYYSGLSGAGPIILDDTGERQLGTAVFWRVTGGAITNR